MVSKALVLSVEHSQQSSCIMVGNCAQTWQETQLNLIKTLLDFFLLQKAEANKLKKSNGSDQNEAEIGQGTCN